MSHFRVQGKSASQVVPRRIVPAPADFGKRGEQAISKWSIDTRPVVVYIERPRVMVWRTIRSAVYVIVPVVAFLFLTWQFVSGITSRTVHVLSGPVGSSIAAILMLSGCIAGYRFLKRDV